MTRILSNYLTDRTATVRIGDYFGQTFQLESGVPQVGCLSPTLFNLYMRDMTDPYGNTEYVAYMQMTSRRLSHRDQNQHSTQLPIDSTSDKDHRRL